VILYRHAPPAFPFLWETAEQPSGRWHGENEGPVHYLADTPDGAWAEFLRHEGIATLDELAGIDRAIWAVEVPDTTVATAAEPSLAPEIFTGGAETYEACRREARRIRGAGAAVLRAPSAALVGGGARGWRVEGGLQPAAARDGQVIAMFGPRPDLVGWQVVERGRPGPDLLDRVRPFTA
jgi:hypothetical protein